MMHIQNPMARGSLWIILGSLFCPCHLPITLPLLLALTAGTALGGLIESNVWLVGGISTLLYLSGLALGFRSLRHNRQPRGGDAAPDPDAQFACCIPGETSAVGPSPRVQAPHEIWNG